jgi:hypothetical protein
MTRDELDRLLEEWFAAPRLAAERVRHQRSGFMVEGGEERRVHHPEPGTEGPATFEVWDYGDALTRAAGWFAQPVRLDPIPHVYRGVSTAEWEQARERGFVQSDGRGTLTRWEGTNAADDPINAVSYLPRGGEGRVLKIRVDPGDGWFTINADSYLRTRQPIPLDRVEAVSPVIAKDLEIHPSLRPEPDAAPGCQITPDEDPSRETDPSREPEMEAC